LALVYGFVSWFGLGVTLGSFQIQLPFFSPLFENAQREFSLEIIGLSLFGLFFLLVGLSGFVLMTRRSWNIELTETGIILRNLFFFKETFFPWEVIKGFSNSEICNYRDFNKSTVWKSDTIVLYMPKGPFEIVKIYNVKFSKIEPVLIENGVRHFGFEAYRIKWFLPSQRYFKHEI